MVCGLNDICFKVFISRLLFISYFIINIKRETLLRRSILRLGIATVTNRPSTPTDYGFSNGWSNLRHFKEST